MKIKNKNIIEIIDNIENIFNIDNYLPVQVNFFLIRNYSVLIMERNRILDIEKRLKDTIVDDIYLNQQLEVLYNLEPDIDIQTIPLSFLEDVNITTLQMKGIMFMIENE